MKYVTKQRWERVLIGSAGILVGYSFALPLIGSDFSAENALRLSGVAMASGFALPAILDCRKGVRSAITGENMLLLGLIYWVLLDILQGAYRVLVTQEAVEAEFGVLALFGVGICLGSACVSATQAAVPSGNDEKRLSPRAYIVAILVCFVLGIFDFLYKSDFDLVLVVQALGESRWNTPWQRDVLGDWGAFSYHLQYFGYLLPALVATLALQVGWHNRWVILGIALSVVILAFHFQGGGRRIVGLIIGAGLCVWFLGIPKVNWVRLLMLIALAVAVLVLMQFMLTIRGEGLTDATYQASFDYLHVDDNFLRLAQTLELVPDSHPYVDWQYLYYVLVRPIPRVFWEAKPVDGGFDLAAALEVPNMGFVLTAAGEWYVMHGLPAVFVGGMAYGLLAGFVNRTLASARTSVDALVPSLWLMVLFLGLRTIVELLLSFYLILAWMVLRTILRQFKVFRLQPVF